MDCGDLSDPENGQVTLSSTIYQSQAVYSCNDGYELSQTGSVQRICRASGVWSSFAPQCNRKLLNTKEYTRLEDQVLSLLPHPFTAIYILNLGNVPWKDTIGN